MDGVLADIYAQYLKFEFEDRGIAQRIEDLNGLKETEAFINCPKYVRTRGFFRDAPVINGSIDGLRQLNEKFSVLIVSSATQFPTSLEEKHDWLNEYFPFISWKQMVFCGTKDMIKGDIMIDDHPGNLDLFEGTKMLFTQPHNFHVINSSYQRVANWNELLTLVN
jgi:5'-nucleotidase